MIDLIGELASLLERLDSEGIPHALCGGLAMAVHSYPRATLDIDLLILPSNLQRVEEIGQELGFDHRAGPMTFQEGKIEIRRMTKIDSATGEFLSTDLLLVSEEIRGVWESRLRVPWNRGEISVVAPEGLIELKSLRLSAQDRADIENLRSLLDET
jgi:hypothetical protein